MPTPKRQPDPILAALGSFDLVFVTLYGEARGEPIDGQVAIANVIKNRLDDGRWGYSYKSVLLAWAQFSCLWPTLGGLNFQRVIDFAKRVRHPETFNISERQLYLVTQGLFSGSIKNNVAEATHYYAESIAPPFWTAPPAVLVGKFGHHRFYSRVR